MEEFGNMDFSEEEVPSQEAIDKERGFSEEELETCLKVLRCFREKLELRNEKRYKELRRLSLVMHEHYNEESRFFDGVDPESYMQSKELRWYKKRERKKRKDADRQRIEARKLRAQRAGALKILLDTNATGEVVLDLPPSAPLVLEGEKTEEEEEEGEEEKMVGKSVIAFEPAMSAQEKARKLHSGGGNKTKGYGGGDASLGSGQGWMKPGSDVVLSSVIMKEKEEENEKDDGELSEDGMVERAVAGDEDYLQKMASCYTCKAVYRKLHHFYDSLCPECAELNWRKRNALVDLRGRIALVTGARVKIGFQIGLKLLRSGALLIATTRFPQDCARRYAQEPDFAKWKERLHVYGLDLRDLAGVEAFTDLVQSRYDHLDILINNAAQTVRRPAAYYAHLLPGEMRKTEDLPPEQRDVLQPMGTLEHARAPSLLLKLAAEAVHGEFIQEELERESAHLAGGEEVKAKEFEGQGKTQEIGDVLGGITYRSAALSQAIVLQEDKEHDKSLFPKHMYDVEGQQLDLRPKNSWKLRLGEVETAELVEVHAINCISPFILNGRLRSLLCAGQAPRFIVNVSAMEGKFYRHKNAAHPHTNMAKASMNMMTRTSAVDYAQDQIFMNSVDTGWINDENPFEKAKEIAKSGFQTPIDEVDAAARVLDPVFVGYAEGICRYGLFFKDYVESEW